MNSDSRNKKMEYHHDSTIELKLSNTCHFDEFATANEEKSHYPIQEEISHFIRNDNSGIKRRLFFGFAAAGAIGFVLTKGILQKIFRMTSTKKEEQKISVSIHPNAIPRSSKGLNVNG